jgi:hypothetical protein
MSVALQIALLLSIVFSIHLFPVFKLIPTSRRICMHIRTYVCPTLWFLRSFNTTLLRCRGQTATRMEEEIGRRTWAYGRIGLLFPSLSLSIIFSIIMLAYPLLTQVTADRETHPHTHREKEERSEGKRGGCREGSGQDRLRVRQVK